MSTSPNQGVERIGASRSGQRQFGRQWRLAPTAHTRRWAGDELATREDQLA